MTTYPAGKMTANITTGIPTALRERFDVILQQWQDAVVAKHIADGLQLANMDQVHGSFGAKYARLDIGSSGAFMVDMSTGIVYSIMGYGKVYKKKISGNIFNPLFNGSVLVRDRFRRGRFMNHTDGTPREAVQS